MINGRTLGWDRGMRYVTVGEAVRWDDLLALTLGLDGLSGREREALGVRDWHAPRVSTSQYGFVLGWAYEVGRRGSDGGD